MATLSSPVRSVEVHGSPILSGKILTADSQEMAALATMDDYARLARKLRGAFALIVREGDQITVVADHSACYPVYYLADRSGTFHVSSSLADLRNHSCRKLSANALFFYATRFGIGDDPLYADVHTVERGHVVRFARGKRTETAWLDWGSFLEQRPLTPAQARDRFIEIASEFFEPYLRSGRGIACSLSSGTDSALCAYVLRRLDPATLCISADYRLSRYSECALASSHARQIGVRHKRILVTSRDHRRALDLMNSPASDLPARHSHLTSLYKLAEYARGEGIRYVVGAEFAGGLFMEFGYFANYRSVADYQRHVGGLSVEQRLEWLFKPQQLDTFSEELLNAIGCSPRDCRAWMDRAVAADRALFEPWVRTFPFPAVTQLKTQIWTGVRFQNGWLPAQRAAGGVEFIDPFLDLEMIRFALSLPLEFKWNGGPSKVLLRDILEAGAGIRAPKRSSPNPARIWGLSPQLAESWRLDPRLRSLYRRETLANYRNLGRSYDRLLTIAGLGKWVRAHGLGDIEESAA